MFKDSGALLPNTRPQHPGPIKPRVSGLERSFSYLAVENGREIRRWHPETAALKPAVERSLRGQK